MNNYILLNDDQYKTIAEAWEPRIVTPREIRVLQDGTLDAAFASVTILEWRGYVEASVTPASEDWGSVADLRAALAVQGSVSFTDHYSSAYTAYISEVGSEDYLSPMWDAASNKMTVEITIMAEA